jgi:hypothetical protein
MVSDSGDVVAVEITRRGRLAKRSQQHILGRPWMTALLMYTIDNIQVSHTIPARPTVLIGIVQNAE